MNEIYKITNKINNKSYIGQTLLYSSNGRYMGYENRFRRHIQNAIRNYKGGCPILENAIRKHGEENFNLECIQKCKLEELNYYEDFYINKYNTLHPNGYNLMSGGGNGRIHSELTKQKMSTTRSGKKHKQITKDRIGLAHKNKIVENKSKQLMSKTKKEKNIKSYPVEIKKAMEELDLNILPMYITYSSYTYTQKNYYFIVYVPDSKKKKFCSQEISLKEKLKLAIQYKNTIINGHRS